MITSCINLGLRSRLVRPRPQGAECQCGELIDRIAADATVRKLVVEAVGHMPMPLAGYRSDHRAGLELPTIDAHRAAEAETTADLERRFEARLFIGNSCLRPSAVVESC
jgi:hypothetical protein